MAGDEDDTDAQRKKKNAAPKKAQPSLRPCDGAAVAYRSEDPLENLKIRVQLKTLIGGYPSKAHPELQPEREPEPMAAEGDDDDEDNDEEDGDGEEGNEDAEPEPVRATLRAKRTRAPPPVLALTLMQTRWPPVPSTGAGARGGPRTGSGP